MKISTTVVLLMGALRAQSPEEKPPRPLSLVEFGKLAGQCAPKAPVTALLAIARIESGYYPLALSVNYPDLAAESLGVGQGSAVLSRQPSTLREALAWTRWFSNRGLTVSIGLMQVNTENLPALGLTAEDLFDPCINITAGWKIFTGHFNEAKAALGSGNQAFRAALSAYNSGSLTQGYANGYVDKTLDSGALKSGQVIEPPQEIATSGVNNVLQSAETKTAEPDPYKAATKVTWKVNTAPWEKKDSTKK